MVASEIDDRLRSAWVQQLQREYDNICFQYRLRLQPPVIELTNSTTLLGSWNGSYRLLSLSTHLIRTSPWSISTAWTTARCELTGSSSPKTSERRGAREMTAAEAQRRPCTKRPGTAVTR